MPAPLEGLSIEEKRELLARVLRQKAEAEARHPLSSHQMRLWFLDQLDPGSVLYNLVTALHITGEIDLAVAQRAVDEIVRRHESLRTTFRSEGGEPLQVITPSLTLPLQSLDLRGMDHRAREEALKRIIKQEARTPFSLATGPLFRLLMIRKDTAEYVTVLTMHHIISDGWSLGVFVRELGFLYYAFSKGHPSPFPELPLQYKEYARWRQEQLQGEVLDRLTAYWRKQLAGAPPGIHLLPDRRPPQSPGDRGARVTLRLPDGLFKELRALSARHGVTLFVTLFSGFLAVLYRWSGQEDLVVGSVVADRERPETQGLIGFLVNSLLLRVNLGGNPTVRELLDRVREVAIGAQANRDLPFELLIQTFQAERNPGYHPLTQVAFAFHNMPLPPLEYPGLRITLLDADTGIAPADLFVHILEKREGPELSLVYKPGLFEQATVERLAHGLHAVLQAFVKDTDQLVDDLPVVTATDRQTLARWNAAAVPVQDGDPVCRLFESQAQQTPDAPAVVASGKTLTYRDLDRLANRIGHRLLQKGVGPDTIVAVCGPRSPVMVAALFGVLKAGGAYLPIDPALPEERRAFMLHDAHATVLLTVQALAGSFSEFPGELLCLDALPAASGTDPDDGIPCAAGPSNLAYVIYTSGSTGLPKGVMVERHSLSSFVHAVIGLFGILPSDRQLQFISLGFDVSVEEIFPPLCAGASILLHPDPARFSTLETLALCEEHGVTMMNVPASYWHQMVDELAAAGRFVPECIRLFKTGAEALSPRKFIQWESLVRHPMRFFNIYGPTEATVIATTYDVPMHCGALEGRSTVPIGRPLPATGIYLLDPRLRLAPLGAPAELCIGGAGVARGYLGRPDLTAARFIPDPFATAPGRKLYRTGDLARYLSDGTLEYLGRVDEQIKIRGFRIEPEEIAAALRRHPAVRDAVVTAREETPGQHRLVAYVVAMTDRQESPAGAEIDAWEDPGRQAQKEPGHHLQSDLLPALRAFVAAHLPQYMIPSQFVFLDAFPVTPNGKIDRNALPDPESQRVETGTAYRPPRTPTETQMAAIWAESLGLDRIGIDDNFFAQGGHSLLVIKVVAATNLALGTSIPVKAVFESPTVAQLAGRVGEFMPGQEPDAALSPREVEPLVPMQTAPAAAALYCFHHVGGQIHSYTHLAAALQGVCRVYGIQSRAVADPSREHASLDAMVTDYAELLKQHQEDGPFFLLGYSTAGMLTMAVAHALEQAGRTVGLIALLDPTPPSAETQQIDNDQLPAILTSLRASFRDEMAAVSQDEESLLREGAKINERFSALPENERAELLYRWLQALSLPQDQARELLTRRLDLTRQHYRLLKAYQPSPVHAPMIICWPARSITGRQTEQISWESWTSGAVHQETIDADHFSLVRPPFAQRIAGRLSELILAPLSMPPGPGLP